MYLRGGEVSKLRAQQQQGSNQSPARPLTPRHTSSQPSMTILANSTSPPPYRRHCAAKVAWNSLGLLRTETTRKAPGTVACPSRDFARASAGRSSLV